jgi:subtilisin family serine protease
LYGPSPTVERTLNQLANEHGLARLDGWHIASLQVYCEVFAATESTDIEALVTALNADPRVELAQPMNVFETLATRYDDPYASLQESMLALELGPAHVLATGKGVRVAVIDSAIDDAHPDLRDRISLNRDLVGDRPGARGGEIHGTAVAGIIASKANNTEGIVGVAPEATITALRACEAPFVDAPTALCSSFSLALAIETAMGAGAQVINLSITGPFDRLLAQLLDAAFARGIIVVAAAAHAPNGFPASYAGVIAARSVGIDAALPPHTLPAPAREILTTTPNAEYAFLSGNSLAAAHVSGVIALLLERDPALDAPRLLNLLGDAADGKGETSISACRALVRLAGEGNCEPDARALTATENHRTR